MASPAAVLAIQVNANTARANAALARTDTQLRKTAVSAERFERSSNRAAGGAGGLTNKVLGLKLAVSALSFAPAVKGANALAASATAMASSLGPLAGLLGTLPGAALGMGTAMTATSLAMGDLKEAVGGLNEDLDTSSKAFKRLSPEGQRFARTLQTMKPQVQQIQRTAQQGLFPGLEQGIRGASRNLPVFNRLIGQTSANLGILAAEAGKQLGSASWGRDLALVGQSNVRILANLGRASINVGNALRHVAVAARPLSEWLGRLALGWSRTLNQQARAGRESGRMAAFFDRTRAITQRLISIVRNLGGGLAAVFRAGRADGDSLWASVNRVAIRFNQWANSLKGQQALARWFREGRTELQTFFRQASARFHELRAQGKTTGEALAGTISDIVFKAITYSVEQMARHAPMLASAFVKGFINAPVLGQLLVGGWLFAKMGGMAAFGGLGSRGGGAFARGFGVAAAGAAVAGFAAHFRNKMNEAARGRFGLPGNLGHPIQNAIFGPLGTGKSSMQIALDGIKRSAQGLIAGGPLEAVKRSFAGIRKEVHAQDVRGRVAGWQAAFDRFRNANNGRAIQGLASQIRAAGQAIGGQFGRQLIDGANKMGLFGRTIRRIHGQISQLKNAVFANAGAMNRSISSNFESIRRNLGLNTTEGRRAVQRNFRAMSSSIVANINAGTISTRDGVQSMWRNLQKYSGNGRKSIQRNFRAIAAEIQSKVNSGAISTRRGMEIILSLLNKGLDQAGIKGGKINVKELNKLTKGLTGKQSGGYINQGKMSGDSVPAVLEKGEYVLNRKAVQKAGTRSLDALNYGQAPRFQEGGSVGYAVGGLAGVNPAAASVARWSNRKYGATVSSGKRNGGGGSHHDRGNAVDLVSGNMKQMGLGIWRAFGSKLEELIHTPMGFSVDHGRKVAPYAQADHYDHVHAAALGKALAAGLGGDILKIPRVVLGGADGPLKSVGQGVLDKVRAGANKKLEAAMASMEGSNGPIMHGSGDVERVFAEVAKKLSRSKTATLALGMAGYAESGMRDLAGGHSSSEGALQLLGSTARGLGVSPHDEAGIASLFFNRGFYGKGGANKLAAQGLPAHLVAQGVQGSAFSSGSNYAAQAGPARAWMRRYNLQEGGPVGMQPGGSVGSKWTPASQGAPNTGWTMGGGAAGSPGSGGGYGSRKSHNFARQVSSMVRHFGDPKSSTPSRKKNLDRLMKDVGGWNLKKGTTDRITQLTNDAAGFAEYADRAQQLTEEGKPGALVNGLDEKGWLWKQLISLFMLRNRLVEAQQALLQSWMDQIKGLMEATKQKAGLDKRIKSGDQTIKNFKKTKASKTKAGKAQLKAMNDTQTRRKRARTALTGKVIPGFNEQIPLITEKGEEIGQQLTSVQGTGAPKGILKTLPALGVLGGDIFSAQLRLRDLGAKTSGITDSGSTERTDLLKAEAMNWQRRFNVSQAQYGVLKDLPFGGSFATGGVVPGPSGAPRQAVVHSGEGVFTPDQMAAMGGGSMPERMTLVIDDRRAKVIWGDQEIRAVVQDETRKMGRHAQRGLPGGR